MKATVALAAVLLSACVLSPQRVALDRVQPGDGLGVGELSIGGQLAVAAGLRILETGDPAICGAWSADGFYPRWYADDVLGAASVSVGGRRVQSNLSFLTEARGPLDGATAGCTPIPSAEGPVEVRLPRITVESDCDDDSGCNKITFRQIAAPPTL